MKNYVISKVKELFDGNDLDITDYYQIMSDKAMYEKTQDWCDLMLGHTAHFDGHHPNFEDANPEFFKEGYVPKDGFWLWGDGDLVYADSIDELLNRNFDYDGIYGIYKYLGLSPTNDLKNKIVESTLPDKDREECLHLISIIQDNEY